MELNPARTALVAVHLQKDICAPDGAFGGFFAAQATSRNVLKVFDSLASAARAAGATVIYTRVAWKPGHPDLVANSPLLGMVKQHNCLVDGTDKAEIIADVAPRPGDLVVTHSRVGGFTASPLDTLLRSRDIDTVMFCGVATNASVEGTARQASDLAYRTIVIADACSTVDQAAHDASIGSLGLLAEIAQSADVIAALKSGKKG